MNTIAMQLKWQMASPWWCTFLTVVAVCIYVLLSPFYLGAKGMSKTIFLPLVPVDGAKYFLAGKVCFCVFLFSQTVPGDMALVLDQELNNIISAKQDDIYGASNIVLSCPGS
jgi:hypothetical protein